MNASSKTWPTSFILHWRRPRIGAGVNLTQFQKAKYFTSLIMSTTSEKPLLKKRWKLQVALFETFSILFPRIRQKNQTWTNNLPINERTQSRRLQGPVFNRQRETVRLHPEKQNPRLQLLLRSVIPNRAQTPKREHLIRLHQSHLPKTSEVTDMLNRQEPS